MKQTTFQDVAVLNIGPIIPFMPRQSVCLAERHAQALLAQIMPELLKGDLEPAAVLDSLILAYNYGHAEGKKEAAKWQSS